MRTLTLSIAAAVSLASAGLASADTRVSDSQYLTAARCTGLAQGAGDEGAKGFESFYETQGKRRSGAIAERAEKTRAKARHSARIANENQRNVFAQELSGSCAAFKS